MDGITSECDKFTETAYENWTRLEIWNEGEKKVSRWIDIVCGFLQGDSYSQVGFCLPEVPACKLLQEIKGYRMGQPGK